MSETNNLSIIIEPQTVVRALSYKNEQFNKRPRVLKINNKRYILLPDCHVGVCDEPECQDEYNNYPGSELCHTFVPVYTYKLQHELCIYHIFEKHNATISKIQNLTFEEQKIIDCL